MKKQYENENGNSISRRVKLANITLYDKIATKYAECRTGPLNVRDRMRISGIVRTISEMTESISILDVGCGTGNILKLSEHYFNDIYGVDISTKMLQEAHEYCPISKLVRADSSKLPFKSNMFDCVSFYSVLHHIYDPFLTLKEAYRVLKEGGILYADNDPNSYFILRKLSPIKRLWHNVDEIEKLAEYHHHHTHGLDPIFIKKQLEDIGFSNVTINFRLPTYTGKEFFNIIYHSTLRVLARLYPAKFCHYFWILAQK